MLSFRHEVFLEVARNLSFSRAGEVLFISQPAISKHIKALENLYKIALFDRRGTGIILTKAGQVLYEYLVKAKNIQQQLQFDLSVFMGEAEAQGELNLGTSTTVTLYIIPPILSRFRQKHKEVDINVVNRNSDNILKALLNHEVDLGIVEARTKLNTIKYQHFLTDEVIPVCSANSQWGKQKEIALEKLPDVPVALREVGSGTLEAVKHALGERNIKITDLNMIIRLGGTEALKNFLLSDNCLGFLPMRSVAKELNAGELVKVNIPNLRIERTFYFVERQGASDSGIHHSFIRLALQYYN